MKKHSQTRLRTLEALESEKNTYNDALGLRFGGSEDLVGGSWTSLGRSVAPLGRLLGTLGRVQIKLLYSIGPRLQDGLQGGIWVDLGRIFFTVLDDGEISSQEGYYAIATQCWVGHGGGKATGNWTCVIGP